MARNEFDGIQMLLIDGNNLLHRLSGSADPGAQRTLIARLRGVLPSAIDTVLMLDGHSESGARSTKVGHSFEIRHSGSLNADDAIVRLVDGHPRGLRSSVTVVSDDRALRDRANHLGAHTKRLDWILDQLGLTAATATGSDENGDERPSWSPGRGATKKKGNPRRAGRRDAQR
jgi:rRNA-processing protein FCF1